MNNIPLTNMAISLSGGGYRATTFHLGALCLLDAIELEAGNRLIQDERRDERNFTLLENVRIISTISGGTLTGIMYALKLAQGGTFKDCYYHLYDLLKDDKLVFHALNKLNSPNRWKNKFKNRNLINSFAEVYNEHFYDGATFRDLYENRNGHLTDAIFGASEFTAGLQYRFQQTGRGQFGSGGLQLPREVYEQIRLADAAASSSCFPGGFEPMTMPTDYSNGPDSRLEEWWQKKKLNFEREATQALAHAEETAAAAAEAAKRQPELAASISVLLEQAAVARQAVAEAETRAQKTQKAATKAMVAVDKAGADERAAAQLKAEKAKEKSEKALVDLENADYAAERADAAVADMAAQHEELTAVLSKAQQASAAATEAVAAAEAAIKAAESKVRSARKKADKRAKQAAEDQQKAAIAQAAANGENVSPAALKEAEQAASRAEKSAEAANKAAEQLKEATADLALIMAEKVVESTADTKKLAVAALGVEDQAAAMERAFAAAVRAEVEAEVSVEKAREATGSVVHASDQLDSCTSAVSLAEATSAKMATYKVHNHPGGVYTRGLDKAAGPARNLAVRATPKKEGDYQKKGGPQKGGKARKKSEAQLRKAAMATEARRKAAAVSAAEEVLKAAKTTVAAGEEAREQLHKSTAARSKALARFASEATQAAELARAAEDKSVLARNEHPLHPTTAIMDGGILDNQGIRGVVMAEKRHTRDGKKPPFIGTYIISDVSGKTMSPYTFPGFTHSRFANFFTLIKLNIAAAVLLVGALVFLFFVQRPVWAVVVASSVLTILVLWFALYLGVRSLFRARVAATFAGDELPEIMKDMKVLVHTPLATVLHLIMFRATSAMKMITDIFLRRIRRLQIQGLYKNTSWNYRIVSNNIYELRDADKLTPDLKKVINAANSMPTTLWFSQTERTDGALDDLIACGQLTLCRQLVNYLKGLKKGDHKTEIWDKIEDYHAEIDGVLEVVEHYWQNFRVDPHWMVKMYAEEREVPVQAHVGELV